MTKLGGRRGGCDKGFGLMLGLGFGFDDNDDWRFDWRSKFCVLGSMMMVTTTGGSMRGDWTMTMARKDEGEFVVFEMGYGFGGGVS